VHGDRWAVHQGAAARSRAPYDDARKSYDELKRAILARGGIRANRDFARSEIPADLYRPRTGLAPDEMAQVLTSTASTTNGE